MNSFILDTWSNFIKIPVTQGDAGTGSFTDGTVNRTMARWKIPEAMRVTAVKRVKILVSAAEEGSYIAQTFVFDTQSKSSLSSLVIAVKKIDSLVSY